ncbi:MAG: hypothetical protein OHK0045_23620 [Raineya sp.]
MKNYNIILLLTFTFTTLQAQVVFDTPYPQAAQVVSFTYTPQEHLKNVEQIEAYAYLGNGKNEVPTMQKVNLEKTNQTWKGQVAPQTDTKSFIIAFFEKGETIPENNKGKGYTQIFYDEKKKPLSGAWMGLNIITNFVYYLEINKSQKIEWARQEFRNHPDNKLRYFDAYTTLILNGDNKKALDELKKLEKKKNLDEDEMVIIYDTHRKQKNQAKTQEWEKKITARYPKSSFSERIKADKIYEEKDADRRVELIKEFLNNYPNSQYKKNFEEILYWRLIFKAAKNNNLEETSRLLEKAPEDIKNELAIQANNYAWELAEENQNLAIAEKLSKFAVEVQNTALQNVEQTQNKDTQIPALREQSIKFSLGMYWDTYGWVLYKQEKYLEALGAFKEAISIHPHNQKDTDYLERYFLAQDKAEKMLLENLVKTNRADQKHKYRLRKLYVMEKKSEEGFEQYLSEMEAEGKRKVQEEILEEITEQKSPNFEIKDLEGKSISLKSLQGKVVVIDFWATWCGPCLSSFPGMQKSVSQYKDDKEVVFLFVGTMDTEKNVKEWAEKNKEKYSFYILYDKENKMSNSFGVKAIPNKFVLDKKGQIRFNRVGFNGSAEATRYELEVMIEAAKKQ